MKPTECIGCPLYDAPGPVYGCGPTNALLLLCGEAPASSEIAFGQPFSGGAGRVLTSLCIPAGINRDGVRLENIVMCRIPGDDLDGYEHADEAVTHCTEAFLEPRLRSGELQPKVLIPLGAYPNWALTRRRGIYNYRGFPYTDPTYDFIILPTVHPAALMRDQTMWNVVVADLHRAKQIAENGYVEPPENFIYVDDPRQLEEFADLVTSQKMEVAVDIENPGGLLHIIGFGLGGGFAIVAPLIDDDGRRMWSEEDELRIVRAAYRILAAEDVDKIVHFEQHERFWLTQYGFVLGGNWWDTHVMHAMVYPPLPHNLGFLGSVHTMRREWKSLAPDWSKMMEEVDK